MEETSSPFFGSIVPVRISERAICERTSPAAPRPKVMKKQPKTKVAHATVPIANIATPISKSVVPRSVRVDDESSPVWNELKNKPKGGQLAYMANGAIEDGLWGIVGFGIGGRVAKIALKRGLKEFERGTMEALKREFKLSKYSETITSGLKYGYEQLKNLKR